MIASLLAMMLSSTPASIVFTLPPSPPKTCNDACAGRYRLPSSDDGSASVKNRALAEDGGECNVVGSRLCTSTPRRILRSSY